MAVFLFSFFVPMDMVSVEERHIPVPCPEQVLSLEFAIVQGDSPKSKARTMRRIHWKHQSTPKVSSSADPLFYPVAVSGVRGQCAALQDGLDLGAVL